MTLVIRADATPQVGAGHVMRCATLAETWLAEGLGGALLWGDVTLPFVQDRLAGIGIPIVASPPEASTVLVVDSYDHGVRDTVPGIARSRLSVLVDDLGWSGRPGDYDVVWNPNAYASDELYAGFRGRVITQRVPLRRGLPSWRGGSSRVAVTLGGGAPVPTVVDAIENWRARDQATIVTTRSGWAPASWETVSADAIWGTFSACAKLLTGGGATVWEAAAVGIPACILVSARNQVLVGRWASVHGVPVIDATRPGDEADLSAKIARGMSGAVALPKVQDGSREVARTLRELAA